MSLRFENRSLRMRSGRGFRRERHLLYAWLTYDRLRRGRSQLRGRNDGMNLRLRLRDLGLGSRLRRFDRSRDGRKPLQWSLRSRDRSCYWRSGRWNNHVLRVSYECRPRYGYMRRLSVHSHDDLLQRHLAHMDIPRYCESERHRKRGGNRCENPARWDELRAGRRNFNIFSAPAIDRRNFWVTGRFDASPASGLQANRFFFAPVLESCI